MSLLRSLRVVNWRRLCVRTITIHCKNDGVPMRPAAGEGLDQVKLVALCDKIVQIRIQEKQHVVPVIMECENAQGNSLSKAEVVFITRKLLQWKRPAHAMEIADWMHYKRPFLRDFRDDILRMDVSIRTGLYRKAVQIFDKLAFHERTLEAYNTLMFMYSQRKMLGQAIFLFYRLRASDLIPNNYTFNLLACLYRRRKHYGYMLNLRTRMEDAGVKPDLCFENNMIEAKYRKEGIEAAEEHFRHILSSSTPLRASHVATYSMMADVYMSAGRFKEAEACLVEIEERMESNQFVKLRKTYQVLMSKYLRMNNFEAGERIWQKIEPKKCDDYITAIVSYGKSGQIEMAEKYFKEADRKGMIEGARMYSPLLNAYASQGLGEKADKLMKKMGEFNVHPDSHCYHFLVVAYLNGNDLDKGLKALERGMLAGKISPHCRLFLGTLSAVLKALADKGDADAANRIFSGWKGSGLSFNTTSYNDLLHVYVKAGTPVQEEVFLRRLKRDNLKPDEETFKLLEQAVKDEQPYRRPNGPRANVPPLHSLIYGQIQ